MKEPYRTLFEGYEEHWVFGPYLLGDEPDWGGLLADDRRLALSSGEKVFLDIAAWFAGPRHYLDRDHQLRIAQALLIDQRTAGV